MMDNQNDTSQQASTQPTVERPPAINPKSSLHPKALLITFALFLIFFVSLTAILLGSRTRSPSQPPPPPISPTISQPSPTPLPAEASAKEGDPTANWKTYSNTEYGYQVKYPPTWIAKERNLTNVSFRSPDTKDDSFAVGIVGIIVDEGSSAVNTEKEADEAFQKTNALLKTQSETEDTYKLEKKITVGDLLAFQTTGGCCLDVGRHVFIFKENNMYRITLYGPLTTLPLMNQEIFNQILSTFRFLKQSPSVTCIPRPACLDAKPRCLMPESENMCPPKPTSNKVVCAQDAKMCPDGSYVSRQGPTCEFAKCP